MVRKNSVIVLEQALLKSKAWLSLNGTAKSIFLIFRTKCQMSKPGRRGKKDWTIDNNGELEFTYIEAKKEYGITAPRFVRGLDQLITRGLLDVTETSLGVHRLKTLYAISDRWRDYGTEDFTEAERTKRSSGYPGFKKNSTNENSRDSTNETVSYKRYKGRSKAFSTNETVRIVNFKNIDKWRNNKWIRTKSA